MTSPGDIDVVVVNWNTGPYLAQCLGSVYESRRESRLGLVAVVDNASHDQSLDLAAAWLSRPESELVVNTENRGFAAACNVGARLGSAPLLLFLNPDTRVLPGSLDRVVTFLVGTGGRTVGICGVGVLDAAGDATISAGPFPSLRLVLGKASGLSRLLPGVFPARHVSELSQTQPVDHVIGAFLVVRRDLFEALGGFDERFFMYYEEVDLCMRARELGWSTYHLAEPGVVHVGNVSSDQVRDIRLFYSLRSRRLYARLHWRRAARLLLDVETFTVELLARLVTETARRRRPPVETVRGYLKFVGSLRQDAQIPLD
jgi:N-acetylglucosaminyl-diphospho-decaprenol L-rhamnosyltransferase